MSQQLHSHQLSRPGVEHRQLQLEKLDTDPVGGDLLPGRIWFDTDTGVIRYYDGDDAVSLSAVSPDLTGITVKVWNGSAWVVDTTVTIYLRRSGDPAPTGLASNDIVLRQT